MSDLRKIVFPYAISVGMTGGPLFKTDMIESSSGLDAGNIVWSYPKHVYEGEGIAARLSDYLTFKAFFLATYGRGYRFLFKDLNDYMINMVDNEAPSPTNYSYWFGVTINPIPDTQIIKYYSVTDIDSTIYNYERNITRVVPNTVQIYANSVLVDPANYSVNNDTGVVSFDSGYAPGTGFDMSIQCQFYVPVRFSSDWQQAVRLGGDSVDLPSFRVVETGV